MRVRPRSGVACWLGGWLGGPLGYLAAAAATMVGVAGLTVPLLDGAARIVPPVTAEASAAAVTHKHGPTAVATATNPPRLADQLAVARSVALRWPTVAAALADGWTLAAPYVPGVGAHYLRFSSVDGTFDVTHPEMLLYGGDSPNSPVVGLAYYVKHHEPVGFAGSADHWHQHLDVCIGPSGPVQGADAIGVCATGKAAPGRWAWMLHAWVVPGWQSPEGVFSMENPRLRQAIVRKGSHPVGASGTRAVAAPPFVVAAAP
jgi:hypothetical protein